MKTLTVVAACALLAVALFVSGCQSEATSDKMSDGQIMEDKMTDGRMGMEKMADEKMTDLFADGAPPNWGTRLRTSSWPR